MKKLAFPAIVILLFSCSSAPTAKWDAASASKTCFDGATKGKYDLTGPQLDRIKGICDCVGKKMVALFKTEKEANEKMLDAVPITTECKEEWEKEQISK